MADELLSAPHVLEYDYRRSLGDTLSRFFTGLRDREILGVKTKAGRVLVPPAEYDPETGEATTEDWSAVGPEGVVKSWAWVAEPLGRHPLDRPFAFALIQLDGADTALTHVVDTGDESAMQTGMRVTAKWADETVGAIRDIVAFVPTPGGGSA